MHLTARIDIHHATDELLYIDLYHVCIYIYVHLCTCIATAQLSASSRPIIFFLVTCVARSALFPVEVEPLLSMSLTS